MKKIENFEEGRKRETKKSSWCLRRGVGKGGVYIFIAACLCHAHPFSLSLSGQ